MTLPKVMYIMGPPGAGKGTQAQMLAEKLEYERFSTGDAFREVARQKTPLGRKVKATIENGFLMPPESAAEVVISAIEEKVKGGQGLIFDGTPRTIKEAEMVDKFFAEKHYGRPLAIYLKVDQEEMIRRNSQRRFCLGISGDFPVQNDRDEKRCVEAGGVVGMRADDKAEKLATRWDEFKQQTYPVVEKYRAEGILREVDGLGTIEEVHSDVMGVIAAFKNDSA